MVFLALCAFVRILESASPTTLFKHPPTGRRHKRPHDLVTGIRSDGALGRGSRCDRFCILTGDLVQETLLDHIICRFQYYRKRKPCIWTDLYRTISDAETDIQNDTRDISHPFFNCLNCSHRFFSPWTNALLTRLPVVWNGILARPSLLLFVGCGDRGMFGGLKALIVNRVGTETNLFAAPWTNKGRPRSCTQNKQVQMTLNHHQATDRKIPKRFDRLSDRTFCSLDAPIP